MKCKDKTLCMDCATAEAVATGRLDAAASRSLREHAADCTTCRNRLAEAEANERLLARLRALRAEHPTPAGRQRMLSTTEERIATSLAAEFE